MTASTFEGQTSSPESIKRDLIAATIENDQRDAYTFHAEINGLTRLGMERMDHESARLQGEKAAALIDVIDAGGDDAESAKAELAALEGQAFGFRLASAKYAIEGNATAHGIDYLGATYDEIKDDNTKLLTDSMAHTMQRVMASGQYSDKRKESWNFPGYASKDRQVSDADYAEAVANMYALAGVERAPEPTVTGSPYTDGRTETVYLTPTKYGFSIRESQISDGTVTSGLVIDKKTA